MRYTQSLIATRRDAPADAEIISHQLMVRAGMIQKMASGIYTYMPLGLRVIRKIEAIIRDEMQASGAEELLLPMVLPADLWEESGRWGFYGKELLRLKDRKDNDFCLGPTHEEGIVDVVRKNIKSYRQLPINLFQIQTKFRDEIRPRFGLMRGREFIMKDAYSFDVDEAAAKKTYQLMYDTYVRIFTRCGLDFKPVEAMTGAIGGSLSHEFQVLAENGEDPILSSDSTDYAANVEKAPLDPPTELTASNQQSASYEKVATSNLTTVDEVAVFLKIGVEQLVKILLFETEQGVVGALLRGDHELVEEKLKLHAGVSQLEKARADVITQELNSAVGFSGPVGLKIPLYADHALVTMTDFVTGANEQDTHLKGVNLGDFETQGFFDLRQAQAGDPCPAGGTYEEFRGIEVGQVFYLGDKYSQAMKATFLNDQGREQVSVMGCYGIGVGRTAAACVEQSHDENGMIWPQAIAPYEVALLSLKMKDEAVATYSKKLYQELRQHGVDVIWDDRMDSPGVKFKDADLIGFPVQLVVGGRGLKENQIEVKLRRSGEKLSLPCDNIVERLKELLAQGV